MPQEVPIDDNRFEIEQTRTDGIGTFTLKFSGEFTGSDSVSGVASSTRGCPVDESWGATSGCCTSCGYCVEP